MGTRQAVAFATISLITAGALGCSGGSSACTPTGALQPNPGPTIIVTVIDSATGRPIADSASGRIAAGPYSDSLTHDASNPDSLLVSGILGADTYAVSIVRPGFQQWLVSGILVAPNSACSAVTTVHLLARLQGAP